LKVRRSHDRMSIGFITTYTITNFVSLNPAHARFTQYNIMWKVCQWLAVCLWFSPGTSVSSTNNTVRHDIREILLKVALNTITLILYLCVRCIIYLVCSIKEFIINEAPGNSINSHIHSYCFNIMLYFFFIVSGSLLKYCFALM